jgi:hypothetical protein
MRCNNGIKNGAKYLMNLANVNNWNAHLSKSLTKAAAKKMMQRKQISELKKNVKDSVSLHNLGEWGSLDRTKLAPYLKRKCPGFIKDGRQIKSQIRCGSYDLQTLQLHRETPKNGICKLCQSGQRETVEHAILSCPHFSQLTNKFLEQMDLVISEFSSSSFKNQLKIILSDDNPQNSDYTIYKYLQQLDRARKARLKEVT